MNLYICDYNRKEVQERYEVSRDFKECDLSGLNLTELSLKYANFEGANLEGVDFTDAKLDFANFRNANLKNARFLGEVTFEGADFRGADFRQAKFGSPILLNSLLHDSFTQVQGSEGLFKTQKELDDWIYDFEAERFDRN